MIAVQAIKAQKQSITPAKFAGWVKAFFENPTIEYKNECSQGSAKKEKVIRRLKLTSEDYDNSINDAKEYIPEVKEEVDATTQRRRGRKPSKAKDVARKPTKKKNKTKSIVEQVVTDEPTVDALMDTMDEIDSMKLPPSLEELSELEMIGEK